MFLHLNAVISICESAPDKQGFTVVSNMPLCIERLKLLTTDSAMLIFPYHKASNSGWFGLMRGGEEGFVGRPV